MGDVHHGRQLSGNYMCCVNVDQKFSIRLQIAENESWAKPVGVHYEVSNESLTFSEETGKNWVGASKS